MNKLLKIVTVVFLACLCHSVYAGVRVKIVVKNDKKALLAGVSIWELPGHKNSQKKDNITDNNGEFFVEVSVGKKAEFSIEDYSGKYRSKKIILDGTVTTYEVVLDLSEDYSKDLKIGAVKITGNLEARKRLQPRPSITKVKGDTIMTVCQFPIDTLLRKDVRVIVQPFFLDSTVHRKYYTEPYVLDGKEYHTTQIRMYDYKIGDKFSGVLPDRIQRESNPVYDPLYNNIVVKNDSLHFVGKTKSRSYHVKDRFYNDSVVYRSADVSKSKWGVLAEVPMMLVANTKLRNDHLWCAGAEVSFENYTKLLHLAKGELFSMGLRNPMRFFEYRLKGTELREDTAIWYPIPNLAKQEKSDQIHVRFAKSKSTIDMSDSLTNIELQKLKASIDGILSDEDAQFRDVTIVGTASPEGSYGYNQKLASDRMGTLLNWIRERIPESKRAYMYPKKDGRVAQWSEVAELMRKDSLISEAEVIENIVAKYSKEDTRGREIRKLAFYQTIEDRYLPQLRKVEYKLGYSIDRALNYEEILRRLKDNPSFSPSPYESFLLYRNEKDPARRLELCKLAYEKHPNYLVFANDYSALLTSAGKPNPQILDGLDVERIKHMGRNYNYKVPVTVHINQMCARILTDNNDAADTLDQMIMARTDCEPQRNSQFTMAHAYLGIKKNSDFSDENYELIKKTGLRNEIIFLLSRNGDSEAATEDDKNAYKLSEGLGDSLALDCVLKAICVSRVEGGTNKEVVEWLKKSFALDPAMEEKCGGEADLQKALAAIRKERKASTAEDAQSVENK